MHISHLIFQYCTSFIINLANDLNVSYYELNVFVFCFLWPLLTALLMLLAVIQTYRVVFNVRKPG